MEDVEKWLQKAKGDLRKAEIMLRNREFDDVALHSQQAAEKALKALMIKKTGQLKKIHDLVELGKDAGMPQPLSDMLKVDDGLYLFKISCRS